MRKLLGLLFILFLVMGLTAQSQADTMTFAGGELSINGGTAVPVYEYSGTLPGVYTEGNFEMTVGGGYWRITNDYGQADYETHSHGTTPTFRFELTSGETFDLLSLNLRMNYSNNGWLIRGSNAYNYVFPYLSNSGAPNMNINFGTNFSGVAYVELYNPLSSANCFGFDDITYNPAPVPEPATMLLLGFGLVGLAGFRRKKFKK